MSSCVGGKTPFLTVSGGEAAFQAAVLCDSLSIAKTPKISKGSGLAHETTLTLFATQFFLPMPPFWNLLRQFDE